MASSSSPRDGADDDLTLRPHAAAAPGGGGDLTPKPFFGEALDLRSLVSSPTMSLDSVAIPPSPLLRAALRNHAASSLGAAEDPLVSNLTPQTAALAAELSALAVMGTGDAPPAPLEVDAARDGAPPEGAPLHLVVKKVSTMVGLIGLIELSQLKRARTGNVEGEGGLAGSERRDVFIDRATSDDASRDSDTST